MARKTLLAGGKDLTHKPRGAPVFQWARQVRQQARDDRQDVPFEVAALVDEGDDRREVGRGGRLSTTRPVLGIQVLQGTVHAVPCSIG